MNKGMTIEYFNDIVFPGKFHNATKMARANQAKGLCKLDEVQQVNFHFITNKKKIPDELFEKFNKKLCLNPVYIPGIEDESFVKTSKDAKDFLNKLYRIIFANRFAVFIFFCKLLRASSSDNFIYLRGPKIIKAVFYATFCKKINYVLELHNYEFGKRYFNDLVHKRVLDNSQMIITITEYTKKKWMERGIDGNKIQVLPSAVDLELFDRIENNKKKLRKELGLPNSSRIATYVGGLYKDRGIEDIVGAAMSHPDIIFLIIGGTLDEINDFKRGIDKSAELPNLKFIGFVDHKIVPKYLKASDLLLAPYSKKVSTVEHMSPLKINEYLAAKVPVIAADLPRIREMAPGDAVVYFEPDNAGQLDSKITLVLGNYSQFQEKAEKAYSIAKNNSWKARAWKIINFPK